MEKLLLACEKSGVVPTRFILVVSVANQTLSLFEEGKLVKQLPCSSSRFGIGQTEGSNCTPLDLPRIAEKIGDGEPAGTVFKGRKVIGHTSQPEFAAATITTRILWLEGLEPGFNRGAQRGFPRALHLHSGHRRRDGDWASDIWRLHTCRGGRPSSPLRPVARRHGGLDCRALNWRIRWKAVSRKHHLVFRFNIR